MPRPAAAPPTPWSPWAPGCPLPWTAAQKRKLCPRRGSAPPVEPFPPAEAWDRMRRHFLWAQDFWRDAVERPQGIWVLEPFLRAHLPAVCERLGAPAVAEAPPPASPEVEAVTLAVLTQRMEGQECIEEHVVDYWVGTAGLCFALEALHVIAGLPAAGGTFPYLPTRLSQPRTDRFSLLGERAAWVRLRHLLAVAGEAEWAAALATAERLREGAPVQERIPLAFLFPDLLEWSEADAREALAGHPRILVKAGCLATCLREGALLERVVAAGRDEAESYERFSGRHFEVAGVAFSLVEGAGPGAVPSLARLLDQARLQDFLSAGDRKACAEALALLPDAAAFEALADRLDIKEVASAAAAFVRRQPRIALPVLAARRARGNGAPAAASLLAALVGSEGALVDELLPGLPGASRRAIEELRRRSDGVRDAAPGDLPPVLASPPWMRFPKGHKKEEKEPTALLLEPLPGEESMVWEEGERDLWLEAALGHSLFGSAIDRFAWYLYGTLDGKEGLYGVHPRRWLALQQDVKTVVPSLARSAAAQPEAGIDLCLPFRSLRLAPIVAREHLRRPRVRAAARRWLARHAECAAAALIPPAMGPAGKAREEAEAALLWLAESGHRETVTAVAVLYGEAARSALDAFLDADPLLRLPVKLPKMPVFWVPASVTRPRLRDRDAVLPLTAVEALGTMLAFSPLGDPYPGIAQVRDACDPESLGRFAWDLFAAWLAAGGPSKEAWAYHALAVLGDDGCARRLGALVRDDWPSAGEHNRAITGLDILEALGSEAALFQLHWISQKGTTKGIRDRAGRKLETVAADRGLTPDDLEDFLLPAFGLGPDGSRQLTYGPRSFRVGFDELLRPYVQDAAGKRLKDLPRPGAADDPQQAETAVRAWKELKRDVKAVAGQRLRRLEQAMCARRRWEARIFSITQAGHPLVGHLARRLVWGAWDAEDRLLGTFRICEDQTLATFADAADDPWELPEGARVGLVHPVDLDEPVLTAWGALFADYEILQPFPQLGREVFRCTAEEGSRRDLIRYAGLQLPTGKLLGLESRGWKRGEPQDGPVSFWTDRPAAGPRRVVSIEFEPGIMNGMPLHHPEQKISCVALVHAEDRKPADVTFGDLDPVVFSEIVRDLETLR
jgi:hypothetical protein